MNVPAEGESMARIKAMVDAELVESVKQAKQVVRERALVPGTAPSVSLSLGITGGNLDKVAKRTAIYTELVDTLEAVLELAGKLQKVLESELTHGAAVTSAEVLTKAAVLLNEARKL